ncbi:hypothetical protein MHYP_G00109340 [Metynnis hypsauchen]
MFYPNPGHAEGLRLRSGRCKRQGEAVRDWFGGAGFLADTLRLREVVVVGKKRQNGGIGEIIRKETPHPGECQDTISEK